jgi:hypothetical protein
MKTTRTIFLAAAIFAGCSAPPDELERTAIEASREGSIATRVTSGRGTAGIEAASRVTARYYWVAKYAATPQQRDVAEAHGRAAVREMKQRQVKPKSRYIAVTTKRDNRAKTSTNVMLFDTESERIIGNDVYDLNERPPAQETLKFETLSATFVGK